MTKHIFVSLPMRDRDLNEIYDDMDTLFCIAKEEYEEVGEDCELIDTVWLDEPNPDILDESVWNLGKSIAALSTADVVVFHPGWREARGCIIEHMICALYNIPYFDVSMDYQFNNSEPINDYTHDWDFVGEVNAEVSNQVARLEGLENIDIHKTDDAVEHDDVDELVDSDPDLNSDILQVDIDSDKSYDRIKKAVKKRFMDKIGVKHSTISPTDSDELDGNDILETHTDELEPGEYDADVR